jgi:hypothetical protein
VTSAGGSMPAAEHDGRHERVIKQTQEHQVGVSEAGKPIIKPA